MPNQLDANGLQTASQTELIDYFTVAIQAIYGANVDLSSSSPDGQWINTIVQEILDIEDLLTQIYTSFDPDQAVGVQLDQRCAINGVQRQAGTNTVQNVTVTVSQALTLYGTDQSVEVPFTVADDAGNQYQLQTTQNPTVAGSYSYSFAASETGPIQSPINTITNQVTVVVGVTSVNNPASYTTLGIVQETDQVLRLRRQRSVQQPAQGYFNSLYAALSNVRGVTSVFLYENVGATVDANGVPGHSIWAIVKGGDDEDIANVIYYKRNAGCGMKGDVLVDITQVNGTIFTIQFDRVQEENLYCAFTVTSIDGVNPPDLEAILTQLPTIFVPGVGEEVDINALATAVQEVDPNTLVTNAGLSLSLGGPYTNVLAPTTKAHQLVLLTQNIYALPIQILPTTPVIVHDQQQQFSAYGGSQAGYVWTLIVNNSGGNITSGGLYTAGSTPSVTDVVQVQDSDTNTRTVNVAVI